MRLLRLLACASTLPLPLAARGLWTARTAPFHPTLHNLGNVGVGGALHAAGAELATRVIDALAYDGRNVRGELAAALAERHLGAHALDVGCGVGTLTGELARHPRSFATVTGVDTSAEMVAVARLRVPNASFLVGNAIDVHRWQMLGDDGPAPDLMTASFVMHEMPRPAHRRMLRSLHRLSPRGEIVLVDIDPVEYRPSAAMRAGEPFVREYMETVDATVAEEAARCGRRVNRESLVDGHVVAWTLSAGGEEGRRGGRRRGAPRRA